MKTDRFKKITVICVHSHFVWQTSDAANAEAVCTYA